MVLVFSFVAPNAYAQEQQATVAEMQVTLDAPDEGSLGESITINWVGPGEKGDVIAVAEVGAKKNHQQNTDNTWQPAYRSDAGNTW